VGPLYGFLIRLNPLKTRSSNPVSAWWGLSPAPFLGRSALEKLLGGCLFSPGSSELRDDGLLRVSHRAAVPRDHLPTRPISGADARSLLAAAVC
jgi:hypothetical protein